MFRQITNKKTKLLELEEIKAKSAFIKYNIAEQLTLQDRIKYANVMDLPRIKRDYPELTHHVNALYALESYAGVIISFSDERIEDLKELTSNEEN